MKKIIIAPFKMHKGLLAFYRQQNIFQDVKTITKEQLISDYFSYIPSKELPKLMNAFGLSYDTCKEVYPYLCLLGDANNSKISELKQYFDYFQNQHLVEKNDYLKQFFLNKEVEIYSYGENDRVLKHILDDMDVSYRFVNTRVNSLNKREILKFDFVDEEVLFVLNSISSLISKEKVSLDNIYIYSSDNLYSYYFEKYADLFGLKINGLIKESMFSSGLSIMFINLYKQYKDVTLAREQLIKEVEEDKNLESFLQVIDTYTYSYLKFDQQLEIFTYELKKHTFESEIYKPAIQIINQPIFVKNAHIFYVDFSITNTPRTFSDNEYLSDFEKEGSFLERSYEKSNYERQKMISFLESDNHFYYSYSHIKNNAVNAPGAFCQDFGMVVKNAPSITTFYSQRFLDLEYAKACDKFDDFKEKTSELALKDLTTTKHKSYSNAFVPFKAIQPTDDLYLSFSSLDNLNKCPFKYYIEKVLKLSEFEDRFDNSLGNLAHGIFEHQYDPDFDFDTRFDIELDKVKEKYDFKPSELILLKGLKEQIKLASNACLLHKKDYIDDATVYTEQQLTYKIDDHAVLGGRIDKIVTFANKYFYIVDYKTSGAKFSDKYLEYGEGAQLIYYTLLCSEFDKTDYLDLSGFYINNVIYTKCAFTTKQKEALVYDYLKLNGKTVINMDSITKMDKSLINGTTSIFYSGLKFNKNGSLSESSTSTYLGLEQLEEYKETVKKVIYDSVARIRNNDFAISPIFHEEKDNACIYCSHKDICYRTFKQFRRIIKK